MSRKPTAKQARFVEELLEHHDPERAAKAAGYAGWERVMESATVRSAIAVALEARRAEWWAARDPDGSIASLLARGFAEPDAGALAALVDRLLENSDPLGATLRELMAAPDLEPLGLQTFEEGGVRQTVPVFRHRALAELTEVGHRAAQLVMLPPIDDDGGLLMLDGSPLRVEPFLIARERVPEAAYRARAVRNDLPPTRGDGLVATGMHCFEAMAWSLALGLELPSLAQWCLAAGPAHEPRQACGLRELYGDVAEHVYLSPTRPSPRRLNFVAGGNYVDGESPFSEVEANESWPSPSQAILGDVGFRPIRSAGSVGSLADRHRAFAARYADTVWWMALEKVAAHGLLDEDGRRYWVEGLGRQVADPDYFGSPKAGAVHVLRQLGEVDRALAVLAERPTRPYLRARQGAVLVALGSEPRALPAMADMLADAAPEVRCQAVRALGHWRREALITELAASGLDTLAALEREGDAVPHTVPRSTLSALGDADRTVRSAALEALSLALDDEPEAVIDCWQRVGIVDADASVRRTARRLLLDAVERVDQAGPALIAVAGHSLRADHRRIDEELDERVLQARLRGDDELVERLERVQQACAGI